MFSKTTFKIIPLVLATAYLSGCAGGQKSQLGTTIGALAGAGAGYYIGKTTGGKDGGMVGALAGAALGGYLGNSIGQYLDERDQQLAAQATNRVLNSPVNTGQPSTISWNSDHNQGVGGNVTVVDSGRDNTGRECKKTRDVAYIQGKEVNGSSTYCRNPANGAWERMA